MVTSFSFLPHYETVDCPNLFSVQIKTDFNEGKRRRKIELNLEHHLKQMIIVYLQEIASL